MAVDPICGMTVDEQSTGITFPYQGITYYFCAVRCRDTFEQSPDFALGQVSFQAHGQAHGIAVQVDLPFQKGPSPAPSPETKPTTRLLLTVTNLSCASCVTRIEEGLGGEAGIVHASVNLATHQVTIDYVPALTTLPVIKEKLQALGYPPNEGASLKATMGEDPELFRRFVGALLLTIPLWAMMLLDLMGGASGHSEWGLILQMILASVIQIWAGWPFYQGAWARARQGSSDMNTLVAVGTTAAYLFSLVAVLFPSRLNAPGIYFDTSATIITLILMGRVLEGRARRRASEAILKLMSIQPDVVHRLDEGNEQEIQRIDVKVGDLLVVRPGEQVPTDGEVVEGYSSVDESMMTGESMPIEKGRGNQVIGGSLNRMGRFVMKATGVGDKTVLAQMIRLVEEAQGSKPSIARLADQIAAYFVPAVLALSLISFVAWAFYATLPQAMTVAISVLIVACPCALGLATPISVIVGIGRGAQLGILIRNGEALERSRKVTTVVIDKTGTLTHGHPSVTEIVNHEMNRQTLLFFAASAEGGTEHPFGRAIVEAARQERIALVSPQQFEATPGKGIFAIIQGRKVLVGTPRWLVEKGVSLSGYQSQLQRLTEEAKTPVVIAVDGEARGVIALADTVKESAKSLIAALHRMGLKVILLTGDHPGVARAIGDEVGVDEILAETLPEDKVRIIARLQGQGHCVAMIGDGINDAPALTQADIGIAMGTGTDVAKSAADMTLLHGRLPDVVTAFSLSAAILNNIKQNLFFAFIYNITLLPLAAGLFYPSFGMTLSPVWAAVAMVLSSISVIANALRIKQFKRTT